MQNCIFLTIRNAWCKMRPKRLQIFPLIAILSLPLQFMLRMVKARLIFSETSSFIYGIVIFSIAHSKSTSTKVIWGSSEAKKSYSRLPVIRTPKYSKFSVIRSQMSFPLDLLTRIRQKLSQLRS